MGPGWQGLVTDLLARLGASGLLAASERLTAVVIGSDADYAAVQQLVARLPAADKIETHHAGADFSQYEYPTLQRLQAACKATKAQIAVYYLHTKGVSKIATDGSENPVWYYWREGMLDVIADKYTDCVASLASGADIAGAYWHESHPSCPPHFSGNFWWATSAHIKRLPDIAKPTTAANPDHARYWAENWLGSVDKIKVADLADKHTEWPYQAILQPADKLRPWTGKPALAAFERCFMVSLDNRPDRRSHAAAQLAAVGAQLVDAGIAEPFSGNVELQRGIPSKTMQVSVPKYKNHAGMAGCALSHWSVLARAVQEGWDSVCIIEDDVVFGKAFNERLAYAIQRLPADWEALWIGHVPHKPAAKAYQHGPLNGYHETLAVPKSVWGTHCYALSRAGMRRMYEWMCSHPLDHPDIALQIICNEMPKGHAHCCWPSLASQNNTSLASDIHTYKDNFPNGMVRFEDGRDRHHTASSNTVKGGFRIVQENGKLRVR